VSVRRQALDEQIVAHLERAQFEPTKPKPEPEPTTIAGKLRQKLPSLTESQITIVAAVTELDRSGNLTINTPNGLKASPDQWAAQAVLDRAHERSARPEPTGQPSVPASNQVIESIKRRAI
jgi:hypothetical protein